MSATHHGQPLLAAGEPLQQASSAMVLVHGRGATAESILSLANEFRVSGMAFLAPQAAGNTWYPNSFLAPLHSNEPWLSSALDVLASVLERINTAGIPWERTILLGFSQGACLASEFVARNARRYGGLAALSGGLIGPPGTPRNYPGSLDGTPIFLGCSDVDPHIPKERVLESADVLQALGGVVTSILYPNLPHTVIRDEIQHVQAIIDALK
ncbi:MAG: phospholipase [Chloroflexi bacterium]|nr:MAG: phospholipase [Chloroflexota bacterium]